MGNSNSKEAEKEEGSASKLREKTRNVCDSLRAKSRKCFIEEKRPFMLNPADSSNWIRTKNWLIGLTKWSLMTFKRAVFF